MLTSEQTTEMPIPDATVRACAHPSERSRAVLATVGVLPFVLLAVAVVALSFGTAALVVAGSMWFTGRMMDARLRGRAVEVTDRTYPDIAHQVRQISWRLGYPKRLRVFIVQDGEIDATLWRVFGRRYLSLNTALVHSMSPDERGFVIARFVGALRARHLRFHEAVGFIEKMEQARILNVLILPFFRAAVYSGDRIGLMWCGNYETAVRAMDKLLLGNDLGTQAPVDGFLDQARELRRSPFRMLSILFSSHPHMSDRYLELAAFAAQQGRPAHLSGRAHDADRHGRRWAWAYAATLLAVVGLVAGGAYAWSRVSGDVLAGQQATGTTTVVVDHPGEGEVPPTEHEPVPDAGRPPSLAEIPVPAYDMDPYTVDQLIVEEGDGADETGLGDTVTFHFASRLPDGTVVANTWLEGVPLSHTLGDGSLIPGLDEALQGLLAGDRVEIVLGSEQAFGLLGSSDGTVPPDTNLGCLVYVVDVQPGA